MPYRASALAGLLLACTPAADVRAAPTAGPPAGFGALTVGQSVKEGSGHGDGTRLSLRWRSADRQASLDLIDDGEAMRAGIALRSCRAIVHYTIYDRRAGEPRLRRGLRDAVGRLAESCTSVPQRELAAWRSEYETAEADFPAAIEEMKRRALTLFGGSLKRCRQARTSNSSLRTMLRCERID